MKRILSLAVGTALIPLVAACSSTATSKPAGKTAASAKSAKGATTAKGTTAPKSATTLAPAPTTTTKAYTVAEQNAIRAGKSYLDFAGFSKAGLIEQLSSKAGDGFKRSDAEFAVSHIKVDWNKEAVESAKAYLKVSGFSKAGLIEQLSSKAGDQYTLSQAKYAADHVGL